jgi:hypothetical protein
MHMTVYLNASVDVSVSLAVAVSLVVAVAASLDPDVFTDLNASVDVTRLICLPP